MATAHAGDASAAAAARGKVRTVAASATPRHSELRDVNGFTCFDLLARAAATTADFHSVAPSVLSTEVAPAAKAHTARQIGAGRRWWMRCATRAQETVCLAHALAGHGGADARPTAASAARRRERRGAGSGRGFRKLHAGRTRRGARHGELGVPGTGGLVAARQFHFTPSAYFELPSTTLRAFCDAYGAIKIGVTVNRDGETLLDVHRAGHKIRAPQDQSSRTRASRPAGAASAASASAPHLARVGLRVPRRRKSSRASASPRPGWRRPACLASAAAYAKINR